MEPEVRVATFRVRTVGDGLAHGTIIDTMDDGKQTEVQFEQVVKKMGQQIQQGPEGAAADGSRGHHFQALARVGYGCWKCVVVRRVSSSSHRAGG